MFSSVDCLFKTSVILLTLNCCLTSMCIKVELIYETSLRHSCNKETLKYSEETTCNVMDGYGFNHGDNFLSPFYNSFFFLNGNGTLANTNFILTHTGTNSPLVFTSQIDYCLMIESPNGKFELTGLKITCLDVECILLDGTYVYSVCKLSRYLRTSVFCQ